MSVERYEGRERRQGCETCSEHGVIDERQRATVAKLAEIHLDVRAVREQLDRYISSSAEQKVVCERRFTNLETRAGLVAVPIAAIVAALMTWVMSRFGIGGS